MWRVTTSARSSWWRTRTIATRSSSPVTEYTSATPSMSASSAARSAMRDGSAWMNTKAATTPARLTPGAAAGRPTGLVAREGGDGPRQCLHAGLQRAEQHGRIGGEPDDDPFDDRPVLLLGDAARARARRHAELGRHAGRVPGHLAGPPRATPDRDGRLDGLGHHPGSRGRPEGAEVEAAVGLGGGGRRPDHRQAGKPLVESEL